MIRSNRFIDLKYFTKSGKHHCFGLKVGKLGHSEKKYLALDRTAVRTCLHQLCAGTDSATMKQTLPNHSPPENATSPKSDHLITFARHCTFWQKCRSDIPSHNLLCLLSWSSYCHGLRVTLRCLHGFFSGIWCAQSGHRATCWQGGSELCMEAVKMSL